MKLESIQPKSNEPAATENQGPTVEQKKEKTDIIDKYIMGEAIEKTIMISKIKVILRAPSIGIVNEIYRDVAQASQDSYVNMQVEASARMISAYLREYNGKDFAAELGEGFDTVEGKENIRSYLDKVLIEPVRDILSDKVFKFYEELKQAFTDESLDFS